MGRGRGETFDGANISEIDISSEEPEIVCSMCHSHKLSHVELRGELGILLF